MKFTVKTEKNNWGTVKMFSNDDGTVRFALYSYDDDRKTIYFSNLFVGANNRNKGYADKILEYATDYAKRRSYDTMILNVIKDSWMREWYERKGFEYIEDCKDDGYDGNVWLKKDLA